MAGYYIYKKKVKNKADGSSTHWSDKKKYETVATYARTGNQDLTARLTGVPEPTIKLWRKSDWWKDALIEIRSQEDSKLDSRMSGLIDRALEAVEDRLINGDYILDSKSGQVIRVPTKMKDTIHAFDRIYDKRQLIRKEPTKITEKVVKPEELLKQIANQFEIMVRGRTPQELEAEEIEYLEREEDIDAVHEEREEGLQEGERTVQLETGTEETTGSPEFSTENNDGSRES